MVVAIVDRDGETRKWMQVSENSYQDGKRADKDSATPSLPIISLLWDSSVQKLMGKAF